MYLRVEGKDPNENRHKLSSTAEGSYNVTNIDERIVFIEKTDKSVKKVFHSGFVLATNPTFNKNGRYPEIDDG